MEPLTDFINHIRVEKRYSAHTIRAYTDDIRQFVLFINIDPDSDEILSVTRAQIRSWVISLLNHNVSSRTIRRKAGSLSTFYKFCLRNELISQNPSDGLVLPKLKKSLPDFVRESSIDLLFNNKLFPEGFPGIRDRLVLELFYCTGMRLSELVSLTSENIDLHKGEIKVLGKRNKERIIPVLHNTLTMIKTYRDEIGKLFGDKDHKYFVLTDNGDPVYPRMIQRLVRKYLTVATSLDKRSPHTLRHTFATHMLNNGAELNAVKELLGHANLAATEIYTHNTYEKLKSIYKQAHPRA
jgi:integrase/recombinase XerC